MAKKRHRDSQPLQHKQPFLAPEPFVTKKKAKRSKQHQTEEKQISVKTSSKILKEALSQQKEVENEERRGRGDDMFAGVVESEVKVLLEKGKGKEVVKGDDSEEEDIDEFEGFDDTETQSFYNGVEDEIDEEEERLLEQFMSKEAGKECTFSDELINKIREREEKASTEKRHLPKLSTDIIDHFKGLGIFLHKYTSGKMPKSFRQIPQMECWEDVLYLTEPGKWSANAMFQATRIFASNLGKNKVKRFYKLILLPRAREDIRRNKRLHFALYQALRKALYKPADFNKGILFPLCESGTCTLREAAITGSIMQKFSVPSEHSSAALQILAGMDYFGTTSYFIKVLIEKRYALPYRVLDALTAHFMRFLEDPRDMPVIWHQCLLSFVQWYRNELTKEDKENLSYLVNQHQSHYKVTPEIKRLLKDSRNRGEVEDPMTIMLPVSKNTIDEDWKDMPEIPMDDMDED